MGCRGSNSVRDKSFGVSLAICVLAVQLLCSFGHVILLVSVSSPLIIIFIIFTLIFIEPMPGPWVLNMLHPPNAFKWHALLFSFINPNREAERSCLKSHNN
jgi:hypothetical protein